MFTSVMMLSVSAGVQSANPVNEKERHKAKGGKRRLNTNLAMQLEGRDFRT